MPKSSKNLEILQLTVEYELRKSKINSTIFVLKRILDTIAITNPTVIQGTEIYNQDDLFKNENLVLNFDKFSETEILFIDQYFVQLLEHIANLCELNIKAKQLNQDLKSKQIELLAGALRKDLIMSQILDNYTK